MEFFWRAALRKSREYYPDYNTADAERKMPANALLFSDMEVVSPDARQGLGDDRPAKLPAGETPQGCACLSPDRLRGFVVPPEIEATQLIWLSLAGDLKRAV